MNTADYLLENAIPNKEAIITERVKYTYQDLRESSERMVFELSSRGVKSKDRVGIVGNNSLFWIASYLAIMKLGAIAVPFATALSTDEIISLVNFTQCKTYCVDRRVFRIFSSSLPDNILFDEVLEQPGNSNWPHDSLIESLDQDAALMFTSGTTSSPRLVRVTHRNIQSNTNSIIEYLQLNSGDRMMSVLQFFYCFGDHMIHQT